MKLEEIYGKYVYIKKYNLYAYYELAGKSLSSSAVIFIHSAGADSRQWHDTVLKLSNKYTYIMLDLIGHGKTFPLNWKAVYEKETYVEYLKEFINALGLTRYVLIGDAVGARICLLYAIKYRPKELFGIIAFEPMDYIPGDWFGPLGTLEKELKDPQAIAKWFISLCSDKTPHENKSKVAWFPLSNSYNITIGDLYSASVDLRNNLKEISCPVLLVRGKDDPLVSSQDIERIRKEIPNSSIIEIENVGHFPQVENPENTAKIIEDFLNTINF